jgi:hypothetical protein
MNSGLDIISVLTGVVSCAAAVIGVWLKLKFDEKKSKQLNYDPNLHGSVISALEFTKSETEADRVYVMEFHNGENYFSGKSQQKLSCTYEVVSEGISCEYASLQNIRVSNMHSMVKYIAMEKPFVCEDVEKYGNDISFKSFLQEKGVQSLFAQPVKSLNGKILGVIIIEYVKEKRAWGVNAQEFMEKQSRVISGYLI